MEGKSLLHSLKSHTLKQPHTSVMTSGKRDNGPVDGKFMDACNVSVPQNPCLNFTPLY